MKTIILLAMALFAFPAYAESSIPEQNIPQNVQDGKLDGKMNLLPVGEIPSPPVNLGAAKSYMSQFCANVNVNAAANNGGQTCQETQKQQACYRFRNAAVNVQQVLDRAVSCEVNTANAVESDCDGLDAGRLDLLKQYWQDEDMAYTILFLPDMVINASANCPEKQQAKQPQAGAKK